jgi:hypothetical protein
MGDIHSEKLKPSGTRKILNKSIRSCSSAQFIEVATIRYDDFLQRFGQQGFNNFHKAIDVSWKSLEVHVRDDFSSE